VAKAPRIGWQRTYHYVGRHLGSAGVATIPLSEDAPYSDQDARFWDWVAATALSLLLVGAVVLGWHIVA